MDEGRGGARKGSGVGKSPERMRLEAIDLIKMLDNHDTNYITTKYKVTRALFYQVLTDQFAKRKIGLKTESSNLHLVPNLAVERKYKGAWMSSNARAYMFENKLLQKQQTTEQKVMYFYKAVLIGKNLLKWKEESVKNNKKP